MAATVRMFPGVGVGGVWLAGCSDRGTSLGWHVCWRAPSRLQPATYVVAQRADLGACCGWVGKLTVFWWVVKCCAGAPKPYVIRQPQAGELIRHCHAAGGQFVGISGVGIPTPCHSDARLAGRLLLRCTCLANQTQQAAS